MGKISKSDLHCHLNGSFSLEFLEKTAKKNNCLQEFEAFKRLRDEYLKDTENQPETGYPEQIVKKVWQLFGHIHKIIQTLEDITEGTKDVIAHSKYREIRTTPKAIGTHSINDYIDAFEKGLNHESNTPKKAYGLLSLDRTIHTVKDAEHFIQRVLNSKNQALVGLDISGNPLAKRTLCGKDLAQVVIMALEKGTNIAIHMGESDTDAEREDTDCVLNALEEWEKKQPHTPNHPFTGRVRLGHCIYLTEPQKEKIRTLGLPIEVCPSCHQKMNWHNKNNPHPVSSIYPDIGAPIVAGTDDESLFGGSIKNERNAMLSFFGNENNLSNKDTKAHQAKYRFCPH